QLPRFRILAFEIEPASDRVAIESVDPPVLEPSAPTSAMGPSAMGALLSSEDPEDLEPLCGQEGAQSVPINDCRGESGFVGGRRLETNFALGSGVGEGTPFGKAKAEAAHQSRSRDREVQTVVNRVVMARALDMPIGNRRLDQDRIAFADFPTPVDSLERRMPGVLA